MPCTLLCEHMRKHVNMHLPQPWIIRKTVFFKVNFYTPVTAVHLLKSSYKTRIREEGIKISKKRTANGQNL